MSRSSKFHGISAARLISILENFILLSCNELNNFATAYKDLNDANRAALIPTISDTTTLAQITLMGTFDARAPVVPRSRCGQVHHLCIYAGAR